jgi:regulator of replication initiation timing
MFGWMFPKVKKHEFEQHKSAVQTALNSVKQDFSNVSKWIKHLDTQDEGLRREVKGLGEELNYIRQELEEIKNLIGEKMGEKEEENAAVFKQRQTTKHKQTAVYGVQTAVQTAVQAAFLDKLSISEKAIIMILANSDLKLSYEDLGVMTGKDSTTIRGQINTIKQKCPGVIEEQIERNNKKRLFIPEKIRGILLRKAKVRQKKPKNEEIEVEIE